MATCSNCKTETTRVRSRWDELGAQLPDECPQCAPGSFEKFTAPSDKKIWMGYEAHPEQYVKAEDGGYDRKPEYRAEQEAKLAQATEDEKEAQRQAVDKKRRERRKEEMDASEMQYALRKAEMIANWIEMSTAQGIDVN